MTDFSVVIAYTCTTGSVRDSTGTKKMILEFAPVHNRYSSKLRSAKIQCYGVRRSNEKVCRMMENLKARQHKKKKKKRKKRKKKNGDLSVEKLESSNFELGGDLNYGTGR